MESINNLTDYVPFDIAQNLHAKGFDVVTEKSYFVGDGEKRYVRVGTLVNSPSNAPHLIAAPTLAEAAKWLRKKHNKFCQITLHCDGENYFYEIEIMDFGKYRYGLFVVDNHFVGNYEQALNKAIKQCLNLIKP